MSGGAVGDSAGSGGILSRIFQFPVRVFGVAAALVAVLVSALTGGLEPAPDAGPRQVAAKTTVAGKPWNVTVNGAGYASKAEPLSPRTKGDHWIAVGATVEITGDETRLDVKDALTLVGIPGLRDKKPSNVVLGRDDKQLPRLHPGLPEKLLFFWEIDPTVARPVQADVQIWGKTYRKDSLAGHWEWLDDEVKAHVVLPVQDLDAA